MNTPTPLALARYATMHRIWNLARREKALARAGITTPLTRADQAALIHEHNREHTRQAQDQAKRRHTEFDHASEQR